MLQPCIDMHLFGILILLAERIVRTQLDHDQISADIEKRKHQEHCNARFRCRRHGVFVLKRRHFESRQIPKRHSRHVIVFVYKRSTEKRY